MSLATAREAAARQRKADALLAELDRLRTNVRYRRLRGEDDAGALERMGTLWWADLARSAGVREPSSATVAAVAQMVRDRT